MVRTPTSLRAGRDYEGGVKLTTFPLAVHLIPCVRTYRSSVRTPATRLVPVITDCAPNWFYLNKRIDIRRLFTLVPGPVYRFILIKNLRATS